MRKITILIVIAVITRVLLLIISPISRTQMNPDQERNFAIALNHVSGKGYTVYDEYKGALVKTAFHSSFPVFIYEWIIKTGLGKQAWINFVYIITILAFAVSIYYFYQTGLQFLGNEKSAFYATIVYSFYPSVMYFVGALFDYENVVLYGLIIIIFRLICLIKENHIRKSDYVFFPAVITVTTLLRPQLIPVFALIFITTLFILLYFHTTFNKKFKLGFAFLSLLVIMLFIGANLPALLKNKQMFGKAVLSTQYGFEFLQGHNAMAKGSWYGNWREPSSDFYQYVHSQISGLNEMDELQESTARRQLAISWIKSHPAGELKLIFRKLALYFLPYNYDVLPGYKWLNPVNLTVHLLFFCYLAYNLFKKRLSYNDLILLSVIAGTVIISVVFFVGYRTRFFAEPFLILCAARFIWQWKTRKADYQLPV